MNNIQDDFIQHIIHNRVFVVRHLERIDTHATKNNAYQWNMVDCKVPKMAYNPYLANLPTRTKVLMECKKKEIKVMITSPFLRCVETAIYLAIKLNISHIQINYGLSEYISDSIFPKSENPYLVGEVMNIGNVYTVTEQYIKDNKDDKYRGVGNITFILDKSGYNTIEYEDDDAHGKRMNDVFNNIPKGNDTLIVTHNYSLRYRKKEDTNDMEYGILYFI